MWTLENELTAVTCELLQMWLAMQVGMWATKGKAPEIVPITHPDRHPKPAAERKKATSDPAQLMAAFGGR